MACHQRNSSIASSTKTVTPTDSWESYFDSWSVEDHEIPDWHPPPVPAIMEPIIVDDELYTPNSLLNTKFNMNHALDLDLDWELDQHYQDYQARCSPKAFGRLNGANLVSKRHAIIMSNRRSSASRPLGPGQTVHQIHQIRRDRRPAPVRRRPDDVDGGMQVDEMANTTTQPCVAPEWRGNAGETARSRDAASACRTLQMTQADQHQQQATTPFWTATSAPTADEARRRGDGQRATRTPARRAPNASSAGASLGVDPPPNPPVSGRRSPMISWPLSPPCPSTIAHPPCLRSCLVTAFSRPNGVTAAET
ncbi:hypothetical protein G647_09784 [Cladophialophora carrionii CBS 160.54]|uniref:Uncharacterized protein n=1 Tax=Cladophialophora carrionii CBS 160.54 TaxID=1279043 RepID=V9DMB6_9EURO|nr:uncharacterized protein G647_09784 [Cladophialophora carrionii CBS 160.54]ETI27102.1 hypothetical protein G647_09784 [Cladophialophora carrionii CBS 160.54]